LEEALDLSSDRLLMMILTDCLTHSLAVSVSPPVVLLVVYVFGRINCFQSEACHFENNEMKCVKRLHSVLLPCIIRIVILI
jgi:hypothetical protein